jgi:hypothetical protein
MAIGVGARYRSSAILLAFGEPGPVGRLVDAALAQVERGVCEGLRNGRAVPVTLDLDEPLPRSPDAELVDLVVEHRPVSERPSRKLEVLWLRAGIGAVGGQEVRR